IRCALLLFDLLVEAFTGGLSRGVSTNGFLSWSGRGTRPSGRLGRTIFNRQDGLPYVDLVAGLHLDVFHLTRNRRRHLDRGLVGLELQDRLILLDPVARFDEHA